MPGDILAIIQYVMQIMMSVTMLSMIFVMYPRCAASADRICEVLNTEKFHRGSGGSQAVRRAEGISHLPRCKLLFSGGKRAGCQPCQL